MLIELETEADTERLGRALASLVTPGVVIGLVGGLGAGKTRLVRAIAEALGVAPDAIASPTFVLIHEYEGRLPVYHCDAYRLDSSAAFEALGAADYFAGGGLCLVEWADRLGDVLPSDAWRVRIGTTAGSPTARWVEIDWPGGPDRSEELRVRLDETTVGLPAVPNVENDRRGGA